ncbi:hypothetical protein [Salmonella phage SD-1_S14]|nr:hypothetical protein [Salmonella phage SD-1_S14]
MLLYTHRKKSAHRVHKCIYYMLVASTEKNYF